MNNSPDLDHNNEYRPDPFADNASASKGMAITSLTLGIISALFFCCCTPLSVPLGISAIILSIIYSKRVGKLDGMALAGLILGIVGIVMSLMLVICSVVNWELIIEAMESFDNGVIPY